LDLFGVNVVWQVWRGNSIPLYQFLDWHHPTSLLHLVLYHIQGPFQLIYRLTTDCHIILSNSQDSVDDIQSSEIRSVDVSFHLADLFGMNQV
jgi:hypothetical protein